MTTCPARQRSRSGVIHTTTEELLRRLALQDESTIETVLAIRLDPPKARLQQRVAAMTRLSALIALDAPVVSYQSVVVDALASGVTADEIVGALIAVAPIVGVARVTSATPAIAMALGYDLDAAFERIDGLDSTT